MAIIVLLSLLVFIYATWINILLILVARRSKTCWRLILKIKFFITIWRLTFLWQNCFGLYWWLTTCWLIYLFWHILHRWVWGWICYNAWGQIERLRRYIARLINVCTTSVVGRNRRRTTINHFMRVWSAIGIGVSYLFSLIVIVCWSVCMIEYLIMTLVVSFSKYIHRFISMFAIIVIRLIWVERHFTNISNFSSRFSTRRVIFTLISAEVLIKLFRRASSIIIFSRAPLFILRWILWDSSVDRVSIIWRRNNSS